MLKLKENNMAYYFYGPNVSYDNALSMNTFVPTYFYQPLNNCTTYGPLIFNECLSNFQTLYTQNPWNNAEKQTSDIKDRSSEFSELNSSQNAKMIDHEQTQRRNRNIQKQLQSAKKNCESNLVNQFLSYFSSYNNSSTMIIKALKKMRMQRKIVKQEEFEKITVFFCKQISIVNSRRQRKYVNKALLQNYFSVQKLEKYMPDILEKANRFQLLTKSQFCELFRRCCFNFFRVISVSSVVSSAKLHKISRPEHIKRRRLIVQTFQKR